MRGDELGLFQEVARFAAIRRVLYPGSYVHITPSHVFDEVVYVDTDPKAKRFFRQLDDVRALLSELRGTPQPVRIGFHGVDHAQVPEQAASFDLLISLYAGFVSEACGWLLRPGGLLLANDSHGDASMAALDPRFELVGGSTCRRPAARRRCGRSPWVSPIGGGHGQARSSHVRLPCSHVPVVRPGRRAAAQHRDPHDADGDADAVSDGS